MTPKGSLIQIARLKARIEKNRGVVMPTPILPYLHHPQPREMPVATLVCSLTMKPFGPIVAGNILITKVDLRKEQCDV